MKFGKYADLTVGQLFDLTKAAYLRWVYYNCSMINFNEEILELLRIDEEWRIDKPGKYPEKEVEHTAYIREGINSGSSFNAFKARGHLSANKRRMQRKFGNPNRYIEKKGIMQARNHGRC